MKASFVESFESRAIAKELLKKADSYIAKLDGVINKYGLRLND